MRKTLKPLLALTITAAFITFSVLCCCTAAAVMTHVHKAAMCSHCQDKSSSNHSTNPVGSCQHQLITAVIAHGQVIASPDVSGNIPIVPVFLDKYILSVPPSLSLAYPPGSPPLGISLTPLYLRTFNLRI